MKFATFILLFVSSVYCFNVPPPTPTPTPQIPVQSQSQSQSSSSIYSLNVDDTTMIINALHYYKKVEKKGNFVKYNNNKINQLRDKINKQFMQQKKYEEKNECPIFHMKGTDVRDIYSFDNL